MSVETEKQTTVLVMIVATLATGIIAGGLAYWLAGDDYRTPGFKQMIEGSDGIGHAIESNLQPPDRWPRLFGPNADSVATDKGVALSWPDVGPPLVWKRPIGVGYSSVVADADRVYLFHRVDDREVLACLDAKTGKEIWEAGYPSKYVDRYGYNAGPRCTPILEGNRIYTLGAEGVLAAWDVANGAGLWSRNINVDYKVEQGFFGVGATPLLEGDNLIVNVGGKATGAGIAAFAANSGKTVWTATSDGASYATPAAATIHGQRHVFVFTEAGLVDLEPVTGKVRWSIPFRSSLYESVNATSPLVAGNSVLVSATYNTGSLCLRVEPDGQYTEAWRDKRGLESHFSNMIHVKGCVYAFSGRHEGNCKLVCVELATGKQRWAQGSELGRGSSIRIGDRLLLWGERGNLGVLKLDDRKPVMESLTPGSLLDGHTWTPPSICQGRMYLRGETELRLYDIAAR